MKRLLCRSIAGMGLLILLLASTSWAQCTEQAPCPELARVHMIGGGVPAAAPAGIAFVQGTGNHAYAQTITKAYASNVTAGSLLVAVLSSVSYTPANGDVTDSIGDNTWAIQHQYSGTTRSAIFSCIAQSSGAMTVTYNPVGTGSYYMAIAIYEFSGVSSATKETSNGASGNNTASAAGNVSPTGAENVYVGGTFNVNEDKACSQTAWTAAGGADVYDNDLGTSYPGLLASYAIVASGTYNYGWTYAASEPFTAITATFK